MTLEGVLSWLTVVIGLVLVGFALRATLYFRHQEQIAGGSWLLVTFKRTVLTIAAVSAWLTFGRAFTLVYGRQGWVSIIGGLVIIWLLLIPVLIQREFESHEGRKG